MSTCNYHRGRRKFSKGHKKKQKRQRILRSSLYGGFMHRTSQGTRSLNGTEKKEIMLKSTKTDRAIPNVQKKKRILKSSPYSGFMQWTSQGTDPFKWGFGNEKKNTSALILSEFLFSSRPKRSTRVPPPSSGGTRVLFFLFFTSTMLLRRQRGIYRQEMVSSKREKLTNSFIDNKQQIFFVIIVLYQKFTRLYCQEKVQY